MTSYVSTPRATRTLAPARGVTPPPPGAPRQGFFSDMIVESGACDNAQLREALDRAGEEHTYSDALVLTGALDDDTLARLRAEYHRLDHVDLDVFAIDPVVTGMIPIKLARRYSALPIALLPSGEVALAVSDPDKLMDVSDLMTALGRPFRTVVSSRSQLERLLSEEPEPPVVAAPAPAPIAVTVPDETAALRRRAEEAEARATAAEQRADAMTAAAAAANEALAQLAETIDQLTRRTRELEAAAAPPVPVPAPVVVELPPPPASAPPPEPVASEPVKARGLRRMIAALRRA